MKYDYEIDAMGLLCPLPVLKVRKKLKTLNAGQTLMVIADDPAAIIDIPHFCNEQGHKLLKKEIIGQKLTFLIEKK